MQYLKRTMINSERGLVMDNYVITIARGYGSGGRTLGKLLAEELGVNCYDRELLLSLIHI